jgi:DNA polymerase-3 subunit delta
MLKYGTMFYILRGQDSFSLGQALRKIKGDLGAPEFLEISTSCLDGQQITFQEFHNNCNSIPFLSPYRLVIVDSLLKRFESTANKEKSTPKAVIGAENKLGEWQQAAGCIEQMPTTTILIFLEEKIKNNNPLLKQVVSLANILDFPPVKEKRLCDWIENMVAKAGRQITPEAVRLLAEFVGGDLWMMSNEIDKLLLYVHDDVITEDIVRQVVPCTQEISIFVLVDAVLLHQVKPAQRALQRLYQEGISSPQIMAMITRQFRLIAQLKGMSPGLTQQQIQNRLGVTSSYSMGKTLVQSRLYKMEEIKRAYHKLLEADMASKNGRYKDKNGKSNSSLPLEILVTELCCADLRKHREIC